MKKWKSCNSYMSGNGVPTGIAITVLAYELFDVKKTYDSYGKKNVYGSSGVMVGEKCHHPQHLC